MLTAIPVAQRIQWLEASIAKMSKALQDAEGLHQELLKVILKEARLTLKGLKHRV